ncbi:hypothetical protein JCM11641_004718 [Rhodosporidiobolus odoratus]
MTRRLTLEVITRIVQQCSTIVHPTELPALAHVSPFFRIAVSHQLLSHPHFSSSTSLSQLLDKLATQPEAAALARCLTLARGDAKKRRMIGKGNKAREEWVEDAITEDQLVTLCQKMVNLVELQLRELTFATLRRRQLGGFSHLNHLRTLSISGRPANPFSLHTVGQLLNTLPHLQHLALRRLRCDRSALDGLPAPALSLASFALFSSPDISSRQLAWLLHSSTNAESLSSVAFDVLPKIRPSLFHPVKWAPVRTTRLFCASEQPGVVEFLPLHCTSVRVLAFDARTAVSASALLQSCEVFDTVREISDFSQTGAGFVVCDLSEALFLKAMQGRVKVRKITLAKKKRGEASARALGTICRALGIDLCYETLEKSGDELYIPREFAALRSIDV